MDDDGYSIHGGDYICNKCTAERMNDNPLIWMMEMKGFMVVIRQVHRQAKVDAYEKGLIPYIAADRKE